MKNTWKKHCELIAKYCDVKYVTDTAIWFFEDGTGFCETADGESYFCATWDEFLLITEG